MHKKRLRGLDLQHWMVESFRFGRRGFEIQATRAEITREGESQPHLPLGRGFDEKGVHRLGAIVLECQR